MKSKPKERKYLLDIQSGEIVKEIPADYSLEKVPSESCDVGVVYNRSNNKYALINLGFELITDFVYEDVHAFSENLAVAKDGDKWGYINPKGDFAIIPQYKKARHFKNGLAKIMDYETGKYGYIDKNGVLITELYDYLGVYSDGLVYARNEGNDSFSFINGKGEIELTMNYPLTEKGSQHTDRLDHFILEEFDCCRSSYLEEIGLNIINNHFYDTINLSFTKFHDGLCQFVDYTDKGAKIGFYDKSGKIAIPAEFDFASRFCNGISFYSNGNNIYECKSGILTSAGEKIEAGDFYWDVVLNDDYEDKLFAFRVNKRNGAPNANGKFGLIDRNGKITVEPIFDRVYAFENGMIEVNNGYKRGFINDAGNYIIPTEYDCTERFNKFGLCVISKYMPNGSVLDGIIDKSGNIIVPIRYEDIEMLSEDRFSAKTEDGYMLFNINGSPVTGKVYENISKCFDNYAIVTNEGKVAYENKDAFKPWCIYKSKDKKYNPTEKIFRRSCGEGRYLYFFECYPGCAEDHGHGFGIMKEDGKVLTDQIFEHIGEYSEGLILGNNVAWCFDYIDIEGNPVLFSFHDTCSEFIDGVAYIVTHNWSHGSLMYHHKDNKNKLVVLGKIRSDRPLIDNRTTFFMNKHGDIVHLDAKQQEEFLQKYFEFRDKHIIKRREQHFEEYVSE